jgi:steroid delta-isomerase
MDASSEWMILEPVAHYKMPGRATTRGKFALLRRPAVQFDMQFEMQSEIPSYPGITMASEQQMRAAMQEYIDAFNRVDLEGIVALYAGDATVEDPVGTPLKVGRKEIEAFYRMSLKTGARLKLAAPIRASHGNAAAMAFDVELNMPQGAAMVRVIDVMTFDEEGKFTSMRAYWGPGDMQLLSAKT